MFGRDRKHPLDSQPMELINDVRLLFGIGFVDREEERAASLAQQANQFQVGASKRGAAVNDHNDGGGFVERDTSLAEDLRRNEIFVFRQNPTSVDNANAAAAPLRIAVEAVARDPWLVANDSAARSDDAVEQRGFAYIRSAHDGQRRYAGCGGGESAGRVVCGLGQNEA